jgi:Holliday junction resolvasome RuvABC endonuclease subunit
MTATGVAHTLAGQPCTHVIKPRETGDHRLTEIRARVREYVKDADLAFVEHLPQHVKSAGITGMVHGVVRLELIEQGIRYFTVPPASLKKFATGRGNCDKAAMILAAFKRGGVEFRDDNECDAWWLYAAASEYAGQPMFSLPGVQVSALSAIREE